MKLTGELKAKVESAEGMEEKKAVIADAGMELTDKELAAVAGGSGGFNFQEKKLKKNTPVFKIFDQSFWESYKERLSAFTIVSVDLDRRFVNNNQDMIDFTPLVRITSPVEGYIPYSAVFKY